jgi:uncharacterized protein (DUF2252 family)
MSRKSKNQVRYAETSLRDQHLTESRNLKMARSAHAYVRGNTAKFYEWLDSKAGRSVPEGPAIWICGDCHTGNLGPIANIDGQVEIQIRDLDQTVIGNPAHDLIRLGLSLATAVRGSDLPGVTTALMLESMIEGYTRAMSTKDMDLDIPKSVRSVMTNSMRRRWPQLARERIKDVKPDIPLGKRFWPVSIQERKSIEELFSTEEIRALVCQVRKRDDAAEINIEDIAYWKKGCSSLGLLRYAVLLSIEGSEELCLMDMKEAVRAVAPKSRSISLPRDNAQRVVEGARALSPNLGDRMHATRLMNRSFFVRELSPQDLKLELDTMGRSETISIAYYLAGVVGRAHARQMTKQVRLNWRRDLLKRSTKALDAPSWLWSSIVDLITSHEAGYLEHCRRHALDMAKDKAA